MTHAQAIAVVGAILKVADPPATLRHTESGLAGMFSGVSLADDYYRRAHAWLMGAEEWDKDRIQGALNGKEGS